MCTSDSARIKRGLRDTHKSAEEGFPGGSVGKNLPPNAGDAGSIPDPEDPTCGRVVKPCAAPADAHAP